MESIIYVNLKCDHPFLCKLPILFSIVKLKLGHIYSRFIYRFKIWILKCWSWAVYSSKCFPIYKSGRLGFLKKPRLHYQIFTNLLKYLKIGIFEVALPSYFCQMLRVVFQYGMWRKRGGANFMIKLAAFEKKCLI